jgi:hypothetical protein
MIAEPEKRRLAGRFERARSLARHHVHDVKALLLQLPQQLRQSGDHYRMNVDGRQRPASMVCWRRSDGGEDGAARRRRGHRSSVRPARHSPPPDDIGVVMEWRP